MPLELPNSIDPALAKDLGQIDPRNLPEVFHGEFRMLQWEWYREEKEGRFQARLVFYFPILPMIRFSIPFELPALKKFNAEVASVIEKLEEKPFDGSTEETQV